VNTLGKPPEVVCMADSYGDQARGQTAMENCLQRAPDINVVYTVNEPTAAGAYKALAAKGREKHVVIVSVDADAAGHTWVQIAAALDAARRMVARDGRVLLLTELAELPSDGIRLIAECRAPRDALQPLRTAAPPDLISATQLAHAIDWTNVYLLSRLEPQLVEDLCMIPLGSEDEALRLIAGDDPCAIVAGAQHTSVRLLEE
jgi:hypothetical protein